MAALTTPLAALTLLTRLNTHEVPCAAETMHGLMCALEGMPVLTSLEIGGYEGGAIGATAIARALSGLTGLKSLGLSRNRLLFEDGDAPLGMEVLASSMTHLTGLGEVKRLKEKMHRLGTKLDRVNEQIQKASASAHDAQGGHGQRARASSEELYWKSSAAVYRKSTRLRGTDSRISASGAL